MDFYKVNTNILRKIIKKKIENPNLFKEKLLFWAQQFQEIVFLDSNRPENQNQLYPTFDFVLAIDAFTSIKSDTFNLFENLKEYQQTTQDWLFGSISYDAKNDVENLSSQNDDIQSFPELFFFQPKKIFFCNDDHLEIHYLNLCDDEIDIDFESILNQEIKTICIENSIEIQSKMTKTEYQFAFENIMNHIQKGDIYEVNLCQEFYAKDVKINPLSTFLKLNQIAKAPFSSFYKVKNNYVLCSSPERYLKKINEKVISQPIKGTAKRDINPNLDVLNYQNLTNSEKENSENIMIVDMVRNDLSKTATKGSVNVEELCKIYHFNTVFQMISTIISNVSEKTAVVDILKTTFPMASMTGVPKTRALQIIENQESSKRGIYSGTIGYFSPENNFDFNVIIRSILYNDALNNLSFSTGSAITIHSNFEDEYQECMAKAKAMFDVLKN